MEKEEIKANKFAKKYGVKLTVVGTPVYRPYFTTDKESRWVFKMKLSRGENSYIFNFGQSINDGNKIPTMYEVLTSIERSDVGSFENFCDEFGYEHYTDSEMKEHIKLYKQVVKQYENIERMFGDIMEELYEIQ